MKARQLKVAAFQGASLADVQTAVNNVTAGRAVSSTDSGTVAYAAGWVGDKTIEHVAYQFNGSVHAVILFYVE